MSATVTMRFDGEVFRPTEPLDLPANTEYRVTIEAIEQAEPSADRPLMKYLDLVVDMGISDLAEQHDHYLYGTPKR